MIRTIQTEEITRNIKEMCMEANHFLAEDMEHAMKKAAEEEKSELGKKILLQLQENLKIAGEEMIPICQDTGMAVFFVEIGQFTTEKTEDVRFIKIVEGMDLYMDDIRETYEENYVGKIINDYDGKQMFVAAIGAYHKGLLGNVLDKSFDNVVAIDIDAQRTYLESKGMDTSEMDDIAVAKANTGTQVFIASNVKFVPDC